MIEFDHVLIAVRDLDSAAAAMEERYGLASIPGGRHTGMGTGNRIIPLGANYVELIAVVDEVEAATTPLGQWVSNLAAGGDRLAALCLRTDDIERTSTRLGSVLLSMERARPDGRVLQWRLAGLTDTLSDPSLPFFIQWEASIEELPGNEKVAHRIEPAGIEWVEIAQDPSVMKERLCDHALDIRVVDGEPGLRSVGIATTESPIVIT